MDLVPKGYSRCTAGEDPGTWQLPMITRVLPVTVKSTRFRPSSLKMLYGASPDQEGFLRI